MRIERPLAALIALSAITVPGRAQWTQSTAAAFTTAGTDQDWDSVGSGALNGLTEAIAESVSFMAGGQADAKTVFVSDFAALRYRGTVRLDNQGVGTRGTAKGTEDPIGAGPYFGGSFSDTITIGRVGGSGDVVFRLNYALEGEASHVGTGLPNWKASLFASAGGIGITQLNNPTTLLTVDGTFPASFGLSDYYEFSAPVGSTLTVSGFLGGSLDIIREAPDQGVSNSMLNAMNTGKFQITTSDPGASFSAASGHDYTVPVPEPASLAALATGALALRGRRRKAA